MKLNRVGFVGWRGMVGSVLLQRMLEENDFSVIAEPVFFTTSQTGQPGPTLDGNSTGLLKDASNLATLATLDVIVTCQGGDYSNQIHPKLRQNGWQGYWIDSASTLRMAENSAIILDPVNMPVIEHNLATGNKDFIGGNCTVSLMLMALDGLLNADLVEWMTVTTYQAASGGGARQMRELIAQMAAIGAATDALVRDPASAILAIDKKVSATMRSADLPTSAIGYPLAGNLLPWVDQDLDCGISREEWKGAAETNKILGRSDAPITIESICIRIGAMRCHSQAFTIKLKQDIPLDEINDILENANHWVTVVPNQREASLTALTPAGVTGSLDIPIGRIRKLAIGNDYLAAFSVGDQLLWGAAEPLRRMLRILSEFEV